MKFPVRTSAAIASFTPAVSAIIVMAAFAAATPTGLHPSPRRLAAVVYRPVMQKVPEVSLDQLKKTGHLEWVVGADTRTDVLTGETKEQEVINGDKNEEVNVAAGLRLGVETGPLRPSGTTGNVHGAELEGGGSTGLVAGIGLDGTEEIINDRPGTGAVIAAINAGIKPGSVPETDVNASSGTELLIGTGPNTETKTVALLGTGTRVVVGTGTNHGNNTGMVPGTGDKLESEEETGTGPNAKMKPVLAPGTQISTGTETMSASEVDAEKLDLEGRNETWKNGLVSGSAEASTESAGAVALKELQEALKSEQAAAGASRPHAGGSKTQPLRRNLQCSSSGPGLFGCCAPISVPQIGFMQSVCLNVSVRLESASATVNLLLNGNSLVEGTFSANNPAPLCVPVPQFPPLTLCIRAYGLGLVGGALRVCINLEAQLAGVPLLVISFDCVRVGPGGVTLEPRPPSVPPVALLPGILPSSNRVSLLQESTTTSSAALTPTLHATSDNRSGLKLATSTLGDQKNTSSILVNEQDHKDQNAEEVYASLKTINGEFVGNSDSSGLAVLHQDHRSHLVDDNRTSISVAKKNRLIENGTGISTNSHTALGSRLDQLASELPIVDVDLKPYITGSLRLDDSKSASSGNVMYDGIALLGSPRKLDSELVQDYPLAPKLETSLNTGVQVDISGVESQKPSSQSLGVSSISKNQLSEISSATLNDNSFGKMNKLVDNVRVKRSFFSPTGISSEMSSLFTDINSDMEQDQSFVKYETNNTLDKNKLKLHLQNASSESYISSNENVPVLHSEVNIQLGKNYPQENTFSALEPNRSLSEQNISHDSELVANVNSNPTTLDKNKTNAQQTNDDSGPYNSNGLTVHSEIGLQLGVSSSEENNTFATLKDDNLITRQNLFDDLKAYSLSNASSDILGKHKNQLYKQNDISSMTVPFNDNIAVFRSDMNELMDKTFSKKENTSMTIKTNHSLPQQNYFESMQVRFVNDAPTFKNKSLDLVNITFENPKVSPLNEILNGTIPNEKMENVTFPLNVSFSPFLNSVNESLNFKIPLSLPTTQNTNILTHIPIESPLSGINNSSTIDIGPLPHSGSELVFSAVKNVSKTNPLHMINSKIQNEITSSNDMNIHSVSKSVPDIPSIIEDMASKINDAVVSNSLFSFPNKGVRENNDSPLQNSAISTEIHSNVHSPMRIFLRHLNSLSNPNTESYSAGEGKDNVFPGLISRIPSNDNTDSGVLSQKKSPSSLLSPFETNFPLLDDLKTNPLGFLSKFPKFSNPLVQDQKTKSEAAIQNVQKPTWNDGIFAFGDFEFRSPSINSKTKLGKNFFKDTNNDDRGDNYNEKWI